MGRVAQLGEHLLCKQGVAGSNPATSTNPFHFERLSGFVLGSHVHLSTNCAKKDRREPLCTIMRDPKPLKTRNVFRQLEALGGNIAV